MTQDKMAENEVENMDLLDYIQQEEKQEELKRTGMVKGGTVVPLKNISDVERILKHSLKTREKFSLKAGTVATQIESKSHLIFNVNVRMKDKDNASLPPVNSIV